MSLQSCYERDFAVLAFSLVDVDKYTYMYRGETFQTYSNIANFGRQLDYPAPDFLCIYIHHVAFDDRTSSPLDGETGVA